MKTLSPLILMFAFLSLTSLPLVRSQGDPQTFWNDYPPCEEQCHESVWAAKQCSLANSCDCTTGSGSGSCLCLADSCLCTTSSWLIAVAQCIGETCGASAVTTAASIAASACVENGYNMAVPSTALVSYGLAAIATPTSTSSNPTSTSTPGNTGSSSASGPNPIIAAYIVPIGIFVATIIVMLLIWYFKPEEAKTFFSKCCGSGLRGAAQTNDQHANGIQLSTLRRNSQPAP